MKSYIICALHKGTYISAEEIGDSCSTHGEIKTAYKILIEKPEGKSPVRCR